MKRAFFLILFLSAAMLFRISPAAAQMPFPSFADLAERLIPSVVNISTLHSPENEEENDTDFQSGTPGIDRFFNQKGNNQVSLGSGFVLSEDGYIITNNHVIDQAEEISVILSDNTKIEAELIGRDMKIDIALIKINTDKKLIPVVFGDSDKIRVGDWVLAIGNPFGLGGSVTAGIVSAKSRDIESGPYDNFIQTDASINQGSSGGPMFNMNGEVIGINSAIFSTTGASMGIGFAIPVNLAKWVVSQLKNTGEVKRGWLGIKIQPNTPEIASSLGLSSEAGALVSGLSENSPAQKSGIKAGDIILDFDGHKIDNTKNLSRLAAETPIGKKVSVTLWRDKKELKIPVLIEQMPEDVPESKKTETKQPAVEGNEVLIEGFGITVTEMSPEAIDKYALNPEIKGIVITGVRSGSDAEQKGLKKGNVIVKIDKKDVFGIDNVLQFVDEAKRENNRPVLLLIQDNETVHFAAIKPDGDSK